MQGGQILQRLRDRFGGAVVDTHEHRGDATLVVDRGTLVDALRFCRDEPTLGFDVLMDLTAVDYQRYPGREDGPRFDVVYHLYSLAQNHRVRVKVRVDEDDAAVPTAVRSMSTSKASARSSRQQRNTSAIASRVTTAVWSPRKSCVSTMAEPNRCRR